MQIDWISKQNRLLSFDIRCPITASFDLLFLGVKETWVIVASGPQLAGSLITTPSCIWLSHASERCSQVPWVWDRAGGVFCTAFHGVWVGVCTSASWLATGEAWPKLSLLHGPAVLMDLAPVVVAALWPSWWVVAGGYFEKLGSRNVCTIFPFSQLARWRAEVVPQQQ